MNAFTSFLFDAGLPLENIEKMDEKSLFKRILSLKPGDEKSLKESKT